MMNTSILTVVLTSALLAGQNGSPTWNHSYSHAQNLGVNQKKPLFVVVGSGPNGWTKVIRDGAPSQEVTQILSQRYVCVYIDVSNPTGRALAESFGITGQSGLIISDRTGESQAFWHQGDLSNDAAIRYLHKYSDPGLTVQGTETVNSVRTSFYPTEAPQQLFRPAFSSGSC